MCVSVVLFSRWWEWDGSKKRKIQSDCIYVLFTWLDNKLNCVDLFIISVFEIVFRQTSWSGNIYCNFYVLLKIRMKMRGLSMVRMYWWARSCPSRTAKKIDQFSVRTFTMFTEIIQLSGEILCSATDGQLPRAFLFTSGFCLLFWTRNDRISLKGDKFLTITF